MKIKPFAKSSDRIVQIRRLFKANCTTEQIVEMGFPHLEVTKVRTSMDEEKVLKNRNETEKRLKDPIKCRECGWQSERDLSTNGVCKLCTDRKTINKQRNGKFRV